jgi:hypothetical protein
MLRTIIAILLVLWILGLVFKLAIELVWGLLVLAVLLGVLDFVLKRKKSA